MKAWIFGLTKSPYDMVMLPGADERDGGPWTSADRYGDIDADEDGEPGGPAAQMFDGEDEDVTEVRVGTRRICWLEEQHGDPMSIGRHACWAGIRLQLILCSQSKVLGRFRVVQSNCIC